MKISTYDNQSGAKVLLEDEMTCGSPRYVLDYVPKNPLPMLGTKAGLQLPQDFL